jgi:hypothetical protein
MEMGARSGWQSSEDVGGFWHIFLFKKFNLFSGDGHRTLGDWELFEVLPASPWLRRADDQMLANLEKSMMVVRNRPAAILFHSKSRPEKSTMTLASEDIVK